ncbi:MAG TPA: GDSL-type esterase/lipase family protein [Flavisolibacter sp.]|nr:GDSL-type esterase/lipase family protein [Flavisolibacter sp.]
MKHKYIFLPLFLFAGSFCKAQSYKFDFGPGVTAKGYIQILPGTAYTSEKGYGFEFSSNLTGKEYKGKDALKDDYITSDKPFYFSVKVPEGNYNVKVILGDKNGRSTTTIKAECRRLMVEKAETGKGKYTTQEFTVHVRDSLIRSTNSKVRLKSREYAYLHWDDKLTLEFNNAAPKVCAVEITAAPKVTTVFLAGNSTVVDQDREPWAAWGQMFPAFFKPNTVAIANYAESGETLRAFKGERRLEKIWSMAKAGDYLFIEFTHNDQKPGSSYLEPFTTYKQTLKEWITEARKRSMIPVLVSSMHRRSFDSLGRINNTLGDYPEAVRQTGKEEGVAVIDLNAMSSTLYEAWGPEKSIKAFVHFAANSFPNQPKEIKDNTHFSTYGAYELARCVVNGVKQNVPALAKHLKNGLPAFNPAKPMPFEEWKLPPSTFIGVVKPDGN